MRGFLAFALLLAVVGCKPLYGGRPEGLKNPPKAGGGSDDPEAAIVWDEECDTKFHEKLTIQPNPTAGRTLFDAASNTLVSAEREGDANQRTALTIEAIEKFKAALNKDPFSAEATYGLAIAYTKVYRKGCTLKLLKRLSDLKQNDKYAPDAQRMIDAASDQNAFKPFKKEAHAALGI
jgi:hypothetical protein